MKYDTEMITTFFPLLIFGVLLIIFVPSIVKENKSTVVRLLFGALFLLSSSAVASSLLSGQLDLEYIINFLCIKEVGPRPYRLAAASAYLLLVWSVVSLFVLKGRQKGNISQPNGD